MRSLVFSITVTVLAFGGLTASVPNKAQAQAPSQQQLGRHGYYNYDPSLYWQWQGGEHRQGWTWNEGRHHYPGYRYYAYPNYGFHVYGGGSSYYVPGYHYSRPHDTRP
jgi:hypothetical protein